MGQDEECTSAVYGWPGKSGGDDNEQNPLAGLFGKDGRHPSLQESSCVLTRQGKAVTGWLEEENNLVMSDLRKCDLLVYRRETSRERAAW